MSPSIETETGTIAELRELVVARRVCAVVDSCIVSEVRSFTIEPDSLAVVSLYDGTPYENYPFVAPHLVELDQDRLQWLLENVWSEPWGVLLFSKCRVQTLVSHFASLLKASDPSGEEWLFRFYDPRVLERYMRVLSVAELSVLLGEIGALGVVNDDGNVQWTGSDVASCRRASMDALRSSAPRIRLRRPEPTPSLKVARSVATVQLSAIHLRALGPHPCLRWSDVQGANELLPNRPPIAPQANAMQVAAIRASALVDPMCANRSFMERSAD